MKPDGFGEITSAQMHHFSDASEQGYGVVSYLLLHNEQLLAHSTLLVSKARVTPLKPIIIPRLELTAATLAIRIDKIWMKELKMPFQDSVFWTDSTSVLKYIQNKTSRFKCYVANRVSEILKVLHVTQWRYVSSSSNPADLVSRGVKVDVFLRNGLWISGPTFLVRPPEEWPKDPTNGDLILSHDPEIKRSALVNMVEVKEEFDSVSHLINYFSTWTRLKKAVAWILCLRKFLMALVRKGSGCMLLLFVLVQIHINRGRLLTRKYRSLNLLCVRTCFQWKNCKRLKWKSFDSVKRINLLRS